MNRTVHAVEANLLNVHGVPNHPWTPLHSINFCVCDDTEDQQVVGFPLHNYNHIQTSDRRIWRSVCVVVESPNDIF